MDTQRSVYLIAICMSLVAVFFWISKMVFTPKKKVNSSLFNWRRKLKWLIFYIQYLISKRKDLVYCQDDTVQSSKLSKKCETGLLKILELNHSNGGLKFKLKIIEDEGENIHGLYEFEIKNKNVAKKFRKRLGEKEKNKDVDERNSKYEGEDFLGIFEVKERKRAVLIGLMFLPKLEGKDIKSILFFGGALFGMVSGIGMCVFQKMWAAFLIGWVAGIIAMVVAVVLNQKTIKKENERRKR
ncbi:MAG: hypothetical protein PHE43_04060 [Candidatus Nanoarchaeia archaeon]|nr:hypothetical protein [Candidatus Nanoarchaeia archaeon]